MFKPVGVVMKKGVSVIHAGKTIHRIVKEWVNAYKSLPDSVQELQVTVSTIIAVTEQHIRLQNTSVEPVLESIYAELNDAKDLLVSYQESKKATLFVKAKSYDRKLTKYTESLKGHLEFLSTALRVAAPTEFNPVNVLKDVDDAALRFWVESFGNVNSMPVAIFRDAILNYARTRFPKGYQKIAANLVIQKEYANATFTIYMFKDLLFQHEGFDMAVKSFAYANPFIEQSFATSQTRVCEYECSCSSSVGRNALMAGATPTPREEEEKAKVLFDPNLKNHFYIVSQVGKDEKSGAAMCLQPSVSSASSEGGNPRVVISPCRGTELQQWSFGSDGYVVNRATGMVLDAECDDKKFVQGAALCVSPVANKNTQNWTFNEKGLVEPAVCKDLCMDVDRAVNEDGARVILWKVDNADAVPPNNQRWKVCRNPPLLLDKSKLENVNTFGEEESETEYTPYPDDIGKK